MGRLTEQQNLIGEPINKLRRKVDIIPRSVLDQPDELTMAQQKLSVSSIKTIHGHIPT